jgi:1-acyl-sn-glycerol-3-phosphate acyltransferase
VDGSELNGWWRAGVPITSPLVHLLFRVRVVGLEHVPLRGPAVLAFNHVSVLDGPVLAIVASRGLKREIRFLVAAEQFRGVFFGRILRWFEQIPVRRGSGDTGALDEAIATVHQGALAAIAPEGRVDDHGGAQGLQRIRGGVARIAIPTGAPVVPVGIWGTQRRWPHSGLSWRRPWRPRLAISFGPPILPFGSVDDPADLEIFRGRLRGHLEEQVERARRLAGDPA